MKVAFLLICHEPAKQLEPLVASQYFKSGDAKLYIHYDGKRSAEDLEKVKSIVPADVQAQFVENRVVCAWGEYSLVEATALMMEAAINDDSFQADYMFLISGSCMPIKPFPSLQRFLQTYNGYDFIQAHDIQKGSWVIGGLEKERYEYYFPFNFLTQRKQFEWAVTIQKRLKVKRLVPEGLKIHFGAQWFCITRDSAEHVVQTLKDPEVLTFFKRSWIPDEFAIQTLCASKPKNVKIYNSNLTYYEFNKNGRPILLSNDHFEHLTKQPFFFARKISPKASVLREKFEEVFGTREIDHSYFEDIGNPTPDYVHYVAKSKSNPAVRAKVGVEDDQWRGAIDAVTKPFFVITGVSREYLLDISQNLRKRYGLRCFDFLFDKHALGAAAERVKFAGIGVEDVARRNYDPAAFLLEVVHSSDQPVGFLLDPCQDEKIRELIRWSKLANVYICDPRLSAPADLIAFAKHDHNRGRSRKVVDEIYAAAFKTAWTPLHYFHEAQQKNESAAIIRNVRTLQPQDSYGDVLRKVQSLLGDCDREFQIKYELMMEGVQ